jgi:hypothetical protein
MESFILPRKLSRVNRQLGAVVVVALVLPISLLGLFVFPRPYDEVAGIVAGA